MFETIIPAPPDSILGLTEACKKDTNPKKINLGMGVFKDETGATPILNSVKVAEKKLLETATTKSYMPIAGAPEYGRLVQSMILGDGHEAIKQGRIRSAHTPGGTAALRVGADFLTKFNAKATVWVSTPTWANHKGVFAAAGFAVSEYPYYEPATHGLAFDRMKESLDKIPANDIVLFHVCCHNPTGVDLSASQWKEVATIAKARRWIPFLDFAYQGYGTGLEEDRTGLFALMEVSPELLVASSFSKNFGLYQERTGAISLMAANSKEADAAFSYIEIAIRVNYSNPPAHGGLIVTTILSDAVLKQQWMNELAAMRGRIAEVRKKFVAGLKEKGAKQDFSFIERQKGMFSYSGLTDAQVKYLREKKSIYMVAGGRINVAGITSQNMGYLCESIVESLNAAGG